MKKLMHTAAGGCAAALLLATGAEAQSDVLPFPMQQVGVDASLEALVLEPDHGLVRELTGLSDVLLSGMLLPDGSLVDLELTRIDVERRGFRFQVNGEARPGLLDGLDLSVWKGSVRGLPGSSAMLGFSAYGTRGWIRTGGELLHLMPRPDASGDWSRGDVLLLTERALNVRGFELQSSCETLTVPEPQGDLPPFTGADDSQRTAQAGQCSLKECKIAIESDYQLYQVFGSLSAMTSYVTTLLSYVSDRYETQVDTVLTFPYVQFYTTPDDPWSEQDSGGSCVDVLYEFQGAWEGSIPGGARIGHFLSGANLGCGVAWLDVLCNDEFNFSVSGNLDGDVSFPVVQQPNNWDFMVVAHELGHNFGSPHTHDYCPPLDECPSSQYWGDCQDEQQCISDGTIMSYCHLCPGGTANITTYFHPTAAGVMSTGAQNCLPDFAPIDVEVPSILSTENPTAVTATITGSPVGAVELYYRYDGGSFSTVAMMDQGGGVYTGDLPAAPCDGSAEFYVAFTDAACGSYTSPPGAPGSVYSAPIGDVVLADDFETDQGWTAQNLGATSGDWQRGVPVNDPDWDYDPVSDYDGSGQCYLTQNEDGNTDVDNGAVELSSPLIDLSGDNPTITYAYFLRLTNEDGTDRLLVEVSENGAAGPWTEVARHDTDGGLSWRTHEISAGDLADAGVNPTSTTMVRFTANDGDEQSIVEAGIDAFVASSADCGGGTFENYCSTSINSTGGEAVMYASGSSSVAANDLQLSSSLVPAGQFGLFYYGPNQVEIPFGNGFRCVGGELYRLPLITASAFLELSYAVDNTVPPATNLTAGSTWNFQAWFRDPAAGGAAFNLSDGMSITFTP